MATKAEKLKVKWEQLDRLWQPYQSLYQEIARYLAPRRQWMRSSGQNLYRHIYDSSPLEAVDRCSAALQTLLCPDGVRWIDFESGNPEFHKKKALEEWIDKVIKIQLDIMRQCKFYLDIDEFFLDLIPLCTAVMYVGKGKRRPLVFRTIPINEVRFAENPDGDVDTLFRKYEMKARQVRDFFGEEALNKDLKDFAEKDPEKDLTIIQGVYPRRSFRKGLSTLDKRNLPFVNEYIETSTMHYLHEGGYHEFPFAVCRLRKVSGEVYGTGMGHVALPNTKTLNVMAMVNLKIGRRIAQPAWDVMSGSYLNPLDPGPDKVNLRQRLGEKAEPLFLGGDIVFSTEQQQMIEEATNRIFLLNELRIPEKDRMTAEEVISAREQATSFVGPSLARIDIEGIYPIVERAFKILYRFGREGIREPVLMPNHPFGDIGINELMLKMRSPLTRSQSYVELRSIARALEMSMPMAQIQPSTLHWINGDEIMKDIFEVTSCPSRYIRKEAEVREIREMEQAQREREELLEGIERSGNVLKNPKQVEDLVRSLKGLL